MVPASVRTQKSGFSGFTAMSNSGIKNIMSKAREVVRFNLVTLAIKLLNLIIV
jgi:hypothetical protein